MTDQITDDGVEQTFTTSEASSRGSLGHPPSYFRGRRLLDITHPDDIAAVAEALADAHHQTGAPVRETEYRIQHIDRSWRTFAAGITNLLHEPAVGGFLINSYDITDRGNHLAEPFLALTQGRFSPLSIGDVITIN